LSGGRAAIGDGDVLAVEHREERVALGGPRY